MADTTKWACWRRAVAAGDQQKLHSYTSQGPLKGVSGTSVYVGDTLYNALGQVTDRYLGSATGQVRQKYTYTQAENFRLTALQSGTSASGYTNLQNITYTYDDQGTVLTVVDAAAFGGSQTQTFTYDALNRLLTAQASGGSNGTYTQRSYVYNNAGNIDSFEGATLAYNDAAHKHAVTHVNNVQKYWYDQNGNATRRVNGTQDVTLAYDVENRVTSITGSGISATYVYDGDGKRVKATVGSVTTVYIGNYYERDNGTTVRKYYYAGAVRVALRTGGNTFYLLNDHLTSTAITTNSSGVRQTELRYFAYGGTRYDAGGQLTLYRYTGQRVESGTGLYDYGARWYDPAIGRFLAADSIVPNPGDSQALNRYMYVLGNPLKYSDPSGHAACGADDRACWENEWTWKNRWYNAHGYFHDGNHWGQQGDAVFSDTGIIQEVLAEAGIRFSDIHRWSLQEMTPVTQGVVRFGQRLSRGLPGLKELLGGWVVFSKTHNLGCFTGGACSLPPGTHHVAFTSAFLKNSSTEYIAQTTVHELAHVIDWQGHFSKTWSGTPLTDYATCASFQCLSSTWETWAEAVTVWVYGAFDVTTGHFATMYKPNEVRSRVVQNRLNEQMLAVQALLGGWR